MNVITEMFRGCYGNPNKARDLIGYMWVVVIKNGFPGEIMLEHPIRTHS